MYPQTVNAYYSPPDGEIVFPAGILQSPFYDYKWPDNLKYGAFGAVAAHELTHAFDNTGAQYDEHGKLTCAKWTSQADIAGRLRDWWTNSTVKAFDERAQCIARQYSKYYVLDGEGKKVFVNGNVSTSQSDEMIAR
jgi:endothelin-converting enzyme